MSRHFTTIPELVIHYLKRWKYSVFKVQKACKKAICRLWADSESTKKSVISGNSCAGKQANIFSVLHKHQ
jgi:hypothetical protein